MRLTPPRLSVVIPSYNRARDIRRCLKSLVAQSCRDFEVLVCDDGSTDDTGAVVCEFRGRLDVQFLPGVNWGGPARARNRGLAAARAPYVAFLDSDDWWAPSKIDVSLRYLERGADVIYHDLYLVSRSRQRRFWRRVRARDMRSPAHDDLVKYGNALPLSSVVARRQLLAEIGGMPEDRELIAMEDYVCWLNMARVTERFVRIPGVYGYYWAAGGNISGDAKTLALLDVFESRFVCGSAGQLPAWVTYARGMALYRLGAFQEARTQFKMLRPGRDPAKIIAKSLWVRVGMTRRRSRSSLVHG